MIAALPYVHRVYLESWNEYEERSGIHAADPRGPWLEENMYIDNRDMFSRHGDPFEYINTTARGAALINQRAENAAVILGVDAPRQASAGTMVDIQIVFRNEGNASWSGAAGYGVWTSHGSIIPIDDAADDISLYRGIFRGRSVAFSFKSQAPPDFGPWTVTFNMAQDGLPFGKEGQVTIQVVPEAGDLQSQEDKVCYKSLLATSYDDAERALLAMTLGGHEPRTVSTEPRPIQMASDAKQSVASELPGLQTKLKQQTIAIERLHRALAEKEAAMSAVLRSKSWRFVTLLRKVASLFIIRFQDETKCDLIGA